MAFPPLQPHDSALRNLRIRRQVNSFRRMPLFRHSLMRNLVLPSQLADFASPPYGETSLEVLFAFLTLLSASFFYAYIHINFGIVRGRNPQKEQRGSDRHLHDKIS